jgi:hypothetical protein
MVDEGKQNHFDSGIGGLIAGLSAVGERKSFSILEKWDLEDNVP